MSAPPSIPPRKEFSPTMRVDVLISDWKATLSPELPEEEQERQLYEQGWEAYLAGDYGFGLWCWHECDRLTNNLNGNIREVTRVLGPGRYFGFSHRRAVALAVPIERIYRPRKGDMSTPRTDAFVLPHYQVLCVYIAHAEAGDPKSKALLEGDSVDLAHAISRGAAGVAETWCGGRRVYARATPAPPATV